MARKKNTLLRTLVPLILVLAGAGVVAAVAVNSGNQTRGGSAPTNTDQADSAAGTPVDTSDDQVADAGRAGDAADAAGATADTSEQAAADLADSAQPSDTTVESAAETIADTVAENATPDTADPAAGGAEAGALAGLFPRVIAEPGVAEGLGSLDGGDGTSMRIEFSPFGSGIASLELGEGFFEEVDGEDHVELQAQRSVPRPGKSDLTAVPFAALALRVTDDQTGETTTVGLAGEGVWNPIAPGVFEAYLDDDAGNPVIRLERRYELVPGTFRVTITRRTENLSAKPLTAIWYETGPIDLPEPITRYGGDKRRVRFGYLRNEKAQAGSAFVTADRDLKGRAKVLGDRSPDDAGYDRWAPEAPLWPTPKTEADGDRLVWAAFTGRYFGVALHPLFDESASQPGGGHKVFDQVAQIDRLVLNPYLGKKDADSAVMVMRLNHTPESLAPGGAAEASMGVYAGPLLKPDLTADPLLESLNLGGLIVYNFGGPCGEMCTFSWLTYVLMGVLRFAHSLVGDWALSIVLLVLIVRTALHPISKWSQIRLLRFSKQMQAIGPKQQKIREKYKDDSKRQQQEMAKLWQEEGINPAGALGCLPMLMQSPIWIALYASLYFAAELRHEAAFWGVFQSISGGHRAFLADLSRPDQMVPLPKALHFTPPIVGGIYGEIQSINLLPVLMGVVFWAHQKYLSPPPSASMSPEMEQQQKLMKIMFPLMMPIFMYAAPSGLTIYFITNSTLGILENKHIRHNAEKKGLLDPEKIKADKAAKRAAQAEKRGGKPGKVGGFMSRLQAIAEQQQQLQQQQAGQKSKKVQNTARKPEPKDRNYKKRK